MIIIQEATYAGSSEPSTVTVPKEHLKELDSLRGLAAMVVVLYHWSHLWADHAFPRWLQVVLVTTPLQLITRGHTSVVLFFVLSGFVLSLPQVRGSKADYPSYLIKRICRIYLPYAVALIVSLLACWKFHGLDAYDEWFQRTWHTAPAFGMVIQHFLLIGEYPNDIYNIAFWSLVQEMRVSLFFPVLCWLILRFRIQGAAIVLGVLLGFEIGAERNQLLPLGILQTVVCVADFIIGILLAHHLMQLRTWLLTLNRWVYCALFVFSAGLYTYTPWIAYHLHSEVLALDGYIAAGGAGLILFTLSNRRLSHIVMTPGISFLGRISYSLYLLHGTVLFLFAYLFSNRLSPMFWLLPYLAVSILGAAIMYRCVEVPSIHLGRTIAAHIGRSRATG